MTDAIARLVEQAEIDSEPINDDYVFECDVYLTRDHYYCNPMTCIDAAMQRLIEIW